MSTYQHNDDALGCPPGESIEPWIIQPGTSGSFRTRSRTRCNGEGNALTDPATPYLCREGLFTSCFRKWWWSTRPSFPRTPVSP